VVTAVFNGAPFVAEAIQSVLQQSLRDWELLIADDGSTDETAEIVARHAATDPRIALLHHEDRRNHGRSAARNLALRAASAPYVAFLDADDLYLPFKLEQQVSLLDAHPRAGMVYGKHLYWHSPGVAVGPGEDYASPLGVPPNRLYEPPTLLRLLLRDEDTHAANCSVLVRRDVCDAVGGFDEGVELYEDTMWLARVLRSHPVFVSGDCTSVYRLHPDSSSRRAEEAGVFDSYGPNAAELAYLEWLERYLDEVGERDGGVRATLAHRLDVYRRPRLHAVRTRLSSGARRARRTVGVAVGR
jgi:glycosyltransferase involved in cell wall biosynthesis